METEGDWMTVLKMFGHHMENFTRLFSISLEVDRIRADRTGQAKEQKRKQQRWQDINQEQTERAKGMQPQGRCRKVWASPCHELHAPVCRWSLSHAVGTSLLTGHVQHYLNRSSCRACLARCLEEKSSAGVDLAFPGYINLQAFGGRNGAGGI